MNWGQVKAAQLRWENIDFEDRSIHIPDTKNGQPHSLPLTTRLIELVETRREDQGHDEWVFPSHGKRKGRGHISEPRFIADVVSRQAGIPPFTIHDLRRTFCTMAARLHLGPFVLQRLMNHAPSGNVTSGYVHLSLDDLRMPMQQITDHFLSFDHSGNAAVVPSLGENQHDSLSH